MSSITVEVLSGSLAFSVGAVQQYLVTLGVNNTEYTTASVKESDKTVEWQQSFDVQKREWPKGQKLTVSLHSKKPAAKTTTLLGQVLFERPLLLPLGGRVEGTFQLTAKGKGAVNSLTLRITDTSLHDTWQQMSEEERGRRIHQQEGELRAREEQQRRAEEEAARALIAKAQGLEEEANQRRDCYIVRLHKGTNLAARDQNGSSDPFVRLQVAVNYN
jgi:hypothetical protein